MEECVMMTASGVRRRRSRASQRGLTLIEVVVSIAILAIIGGVLAGLFGVGLKALGPTGAQARLLGSHDLTVLEQSLGRDAARAACVEVPPGGPGHTYGSCSHGFASVTACASTSLCLGWVQVSNLTCHVAVYATGTSISGTRAEYSVAGAAITPLGSVPLAREQPVNIVLGGLVTTTPPGESYTWVRSLQATVSAANIANAPSQRLGLHPLATDPAGAAAGITPSTGPPVVIPC